MIISNRKVFKYVIYLLKSDVLSIQTFNFYIQQQKQLPLKRHLRLIKVMNDIFHGYLLETIIQ